MLSHVPPKQNNEKIDVNGLKEFYSLKESYHHGAPGMDYIQKLDYYKILASTLSKQLPAERYNGIINLYYIILYPNATPEEIANTLVSCTVTQKLHSSKFAEKIAKAIIYKAFTMYIFRIMCMERTMKQQQRNRTLIYTIFQNQVCQMAKCVQSFTSILFKSNLFNDDSFLYSKSQWVNSC